MIFKLDNLQKKKKKSAKSNYFSIIHQATNYQNYLHQKKRYKIITIRIILKTL